MNANFKGVNVVLSDKAADDIWDKIDQIDDKDEEQDAKDIEQDEAIAGKLDKDDGMGLIDQKFGGIDNAIETLVEKTGDIDTDIEGINETIENLSGETGQSIEDINNAIEGLSGTVETIVEKLGDVISNAVKVEEKVLWTGLAIDPNTVIDLSDPITDFDYIDFYYAGRDEIMTVRPQTIQADYIHITGVHVRSNGAADPSKIAAFMITVELYNGNVSKLNVSHNVQWSWEGLNTDNAVSVVPTTITGLTKVVGRKITPLSDIINTGE